MSRASDQITEYLSVGGLFNPELMNQYQHEAVRDTLVKARDDIQKLESENAELRKDKERMDWLEAKQYALWFFVGADPSPAFSALTPRAAIDAAKEAKP